jgi:hypothetical protein
LDRVKAETKNDWFGNTAAMTHRNSTTHTILINVLFMFVSPKVPGLSHFETILNVSHILRYDTHVIKLAVHAYNANTRALRSTLRKDFLSLFESVRDFQKQSPLILPAWIRFSLA